MTDEPGFIFVTCQVGAEPAVKRELARLRPDFRFSYSRPGFLTFKSPSGESLPDDFDLPAVFARAHGLSLGKSAGGVCGRFDHNRRRAAHGLSLGKSAGGSDDERAACVARVAIDGKYDALHVWQRDLAAPGHRGFQPGVTEAARQAEASIRAAIAAAGATAPARMAAPGKRVLDCILVERDQWWLGRHRAGGVERTWPGGLFPAVLPEDAVSRAWLKMSEALAWSGLPIEPGQQCVEIGCSPGGASQALLDRGLLVTGIDPAEVDPRVTSHPNFVHIRKRGADVRRRQFRKVRWLMADMNVAPDYTLDTVESIVTHDEVNVRGLILQLKLLEWSLADELPGYLERIRQWGYRNVRARQLANNRQDVCVAAVRTNR
jgi:23S rRNA (cytidine2498-2'-O)-methyltransferase